jgi:hypothetical protein
MIKVIILKKAFAGFTATSAVAEHGVSATVCKPWSQVHKEFLRLDEKRTKDANMQVAQREIQVTALGRFFLLTEYNLGQLM